MNAVTLIGYIVIPLCSLLVLPLIKNYFSNIEARLKHLEQTMQTRISEVDTKHLIEEKIDPVKETLDDIKTRIEKLTDYLLTK